MNLKAQTVNDLIANLVKIQKEHGNLELCSSIDDEGNSFGQIWFTPSVGILEVDDFTPTEDMGRDDIKPTHICVN